jgi:GrpB-like predicted nucleotidyltransferase (UPF0157 family)
MSRSDMPAEPNFVLHRDDVEARVNAERLFERVRNELGALLPSADIRHVGATAIAGCLTKGDLDIAVRVAADQFVIADAALAARFARNIGSGRTDTFSSFEDPGVSPHLGIQLAVAGSEDDFFHHFADALNQDAELIAQYNALKLQFDGQPMDVYRAAKGVFVTTVLGRVGR